MDRNEIMENIRNGFNCSQIVLGAFAEQLGYSQEEAFRMACPFGGGMCRGDTCGAVTGALIALGLAYGNDQPGNTEQVQICQEKIVQFQEEFIRLYGSTICRELLNYDFRNPEEKIQAKESGTITRLCPNLIQTAIDITEGLLEEN